VLESVRTRFFKVVEVSDSLDEEARERLLSRYEEELADYTSAFISSVSYGVVRAERSGDSVLISSLSETA
jgi:hypothetical protein